MPSSSIRCTCPHCEGRLAINPKFAGKKIKCPKCQDPFVVEPLDDVESVEEAPKAARKPALSAVNGNGRMQDELPRKRKRVVDDDDEEDEEEEEVRAPRRKRKKKKSSIMPWVLVGVGAAVLIGVAITLVIVLRKDKDSTSADNTRDKKSDTRDRRSGNDGKTDAVVPKNDGPGNTTQPQPMPMPGATGDVPPMPKTDTTAERDPTLRPGIPPRPKGPPMAAKPVMP